MSIAGIFPHLSWKRIGIYKGWDQTAPYRQAPLESGSCSIDVRQSSAVLSVSCMKVGGRPSTSQAGIQSADLKGFLQSDTGHNASARRKRPEGGSHPYLSCECASVRFGRPGDRVSSVNRIGDDTTNF
jgi:hypothetical protein